MRSAQLARCSTKRFRKARQSPVDSASAAHTDRTSFAIGQSVLCKPGGLRLQHTCSVIVVRNRFLPLAQPVTAQTVPGTYEQLASLRGALDLV